MMKNFPNLVKQIDMQVQDVQCPKVNSKRPIARNIVMKIPKVKDERAARKKLLVI